MVTGNSSNDTQREQQNSYRYGNDRRSAFRQIPTEGMGTKKMADVVAVVAAWFIALALVYMAIIKICIKFH